MIVGGIPAPAQSAALWRICGDRDTHTLRFCRLQSSKQSPGPQTGCLQSCHNPPISRLQFSFSPRGTLSDMCVALTTRFSTSLPPGAASCAQARLVKMAWPKLSTKRNGRPSTSLDVFRRMPRSRCMPPRGCLSPWWFVAAASKVDKYAHPYGLISHGPSRGIAHRILL